MESRTERRKRRRGHPLRLPETEEDSSGLRPTRRPFSSVPRGDGRKPMASSPARQTWSRPGQTLAVDKKGPGPKEGRVCRRWMKG